MPKIAILLIVLLLLNNIVAQIQFKSGQELVKFMFEQVDKTLVIDQSSPQQVASVFKLSSDNSSEMTHINFRPVGKNYYLDYGFNFGSAVLHNMQVDAFYDEGFENQAVEEAQEVLKSVHTRLGDPTYSSTDYFTWDRERYIIEVGTYENGWGVYIYSYQYNFTDSHLNCDGKAGDFFSLKNELFTLFFDQLKIDQLNTKISSKEMVNYTGSEEFFSNEYEGIFVEGSFNYNNGELNEIWFDYFYDCPETITHLDADANDLKKLIMERTKVSATVTQNEGVMDYLWKFPSFELKFTQYHDGYGFYAVRMQK
jgi:hypothetical protein